MNINYTFEEATRLYRISSGEERPSAESDKFIAAMMLRILNAADDEESYKAEQNERVI